MNKSNRIHNFAALLFGFALLFGYADAPEAAAQSGTTQTEMLTLAGTGVGRHTWGFILGPDEGGYTGEINFTGEETINYKVSNDNWSAVLYTGYYEMLFNTGTSRDQPAGTLKLYLNLDEREGIQDNVLSAMPLYIEAVYNAGMDLAAEKITLKYSGGNHLFSHNGTDQTVYELESMFGGEPSIYPYQMIDYLTGNWLCYLPGVFGSNIQIYYSDFGYFTRDFHLNFINYEDGYDFWDIYGGIASWVEDYYEEMNVLRLNFYLPGRTEETYYFKDRGIHRNMRMMTLSPYDYSANSIFDEMLLKDRYGYELTPVVFAKETAEKRTGRKLINGTFYAVFWEFDYETGTVWLTESGLDGNDPACVSMEYKVNNAEDRIIRETLPGMDCIITTNSSGEITGFILPKG